jgi:hypothetical protein
MRCSMRRGDADKEKAKSGEEGGVKKRRFLGNQPAVNICIAEQNTHTHTHTHTHTVHELAEACQQAQAIHSGFPRPLFQ